jgi:hypothetical protein
MVLLQGEVFSDSETGLLCWVSKDGTRGFDGVDLVPRDVLWGACPDAAAALAQYRKYKHLPKSASAMMAWSAWFGAR